MVVVPSMMAPTGAGSLSICFNKISHGKLDQNVVCFMNAVPSGKLDICVDKTAGLLNGLGLVKVERCDVKTR